MSNPTDQEMSFEHSASFSPGEISGNVRLGKLEMMYEELFAEVIEDGIITADERQKLDKMAESLGLDRARLRNIEVALQAAYESRHQVVIKELYESGDDQAGPRASISLDTPKDDRTLALQRRVAFLEARVAELQLALEDAQSQITVDVDLSDVAPDKKDVPDDDPVELMKRLRHDPRDAESLHALFRVYQRLGDVDRAFCIAHALTYLGLAEEQERALYTQHRETALIRPKSALPNEAWGRLLLHPDEETLVGEIFSVITPAVLLGRIAALRRDKVLTRLDPARKQDPATSTIQAIKCFSWASSILGMAPPPLFADPDYEGVVEMVPAMPPATRIGQKALSGRSASELAFLAGRHLTYHREHEFMRALIPAIPDLEEIFLAALLIGNPSMPVNDRVKQVVVPIAKAIEPILEPVGIDRLRGHFLRFLEEGGRTNLQRWASGVDRTAARAGFLLANDLKSASNVFEVEDKAHAQEQMDDLLSFVVSDRYSRLRKGIGIAVA
jgi:hypothetical protein